MAAVAAVLGGAFGFLVAVLSWTLLDVTLLQGLGLWSGAGLFAMASLMATVRRSPAQRLQPVRA